MAQRVEKQGDELYCPTCEQTFARGDRCPSDYARLVRIAGSRDQLIGRELDGRYVRVKTRRGLEWAIFLSFAPALPGHPPSAAALIGAFAPCD